jgi:ABC-type methionine transport system permease subunit
VASIEWTVITVAVVTAVVQVEPVQWNGDSAS